MNMVQGEVGVVSMMSWTEQSQAGTGVCGDRTKINTGKKSLSQQK